MKRKRESFKKKKKDLSESRPTSYLSGSQSFQAAALAASRALGANTQNTQHAVFLHTKALASARSSSIVSPGGGPFSSRYYDFSSGQVGFHGLSGARAWRETPTMGLVCRGHNTHIMAATPVSLGDQRPGNRVPQKGPEDRLIQALLLWGFERSCRCWLPCRGMNARARRGGWGARKE